MYRNFFDKLNYAYDAFIGELFWIDSLMD